METLLGEVAIEDDPWGQIMRGWTGQDEYPWQKPIVNDLATGALAALQEGITREKLFG
jgi:hypothetical protein